MRESKAKPHPCRRLPKSANETMERWIHYHGWERGRNEQKIPKGTWERDRETLENCTARHGRNKVGGNVFNPRSRSRGDDGGRRGRLDLRLLCRSGGLSGGRGLRSRLSLPRRLIWRRGDTVGTGRRATGLLKELQLDRQQ